MFQIGNVEMVYIHHSNHADFTPKKGRSEMAVSIGACVGNLVPVVMYEGHQ